MRFFVAPGVRGERDFSEVSQSIYKLELNMALALALLIGRKQIEGGVKYRIFRKKDVLSPEMKTQR